MAVGLCTLVWEPKTPLLQAPKLGTWGWTQVVHVNLIAPENQNVARPILKTSNGPLRWQG